MTYDVGEVVRNIPTRQIGVVVKVGRSAYLVNWEAFGEMWTDEDKVELWRDRYYSEMHETQDP